MTALMSPADEAAAAAAAVAPQVTASAPPAPPGMSAAAAAAAAMAQAELARAELEAGPWEDERSGGLAMHMYDNPLAMDRGFSAAQGVGGHQAAVTHKLQLVRCTVPASMPHSNLQAAAPDAVTSTSGPALPEIIFW